MPYVHVDFHEQGINNPYYFAPAAQPFHEVITPWQRDFQVMIGKNHAKYFDANGWLYFTKEVFDLFYPSYGDTYPTYNGAIGMTYEQGGGPAGGRDSMAGSRPGLRLSHRHATGRGQRPRGRRDLPSSRRRAPRHRVGGGASGVDDAGHEPRLTIVQ